MSTFKRIPPFKIVQEANRIWQKIQELEKLSDENPKLFTEEHAQELMSAQKQWFSFSQQHEDNIELICQFINHKN